MKLKFSYVDAGIHPTRGQILYWRKDAIGKGDISRYQLYICDILGAVAQVVEQCDRLLSFIDSVENGKEDEIVAGGNDVTLTFRRSGIQVDIDINDDWVGQPEGLFSLQEWRAALDGWRNFLTMPKSLETVVEVDLNKAR